MKDKKHTESFNVPKDYFKEFEDRIFIRLSEDIIPKKTGFSVPENYFNQVEEQLVETLKSNKIETKVISIVSKKTLVYAASIAAIAILFFSLFNSSKSIVTIDEIDISTIENYIEDDSLDINSQDLAVLLNEEDFNILAIENEFISENNLEEYLLENIEDTSIIIEY